MGQKNSAFDTASTNVDYGVDWKAQGAGDHLHHHISNSHPPCKPSQVSRLRSTPKDLPGRGDTNSPYLGNDAKNEPRMSSSLMSRRGNMLPDIKTTWPQPRTTIPKVERVAPVRKRATAPSQVATHPQWSLVDSDDELYELTGAAHPSSVTNLPAGAATNGQPSNFRTPTTNIGHNVHGSEPKLVLEVDSTTPSPSQSPILTSVDHSRKRTSSDIEHGTNKRRLLVTQRAQKIISTTLTDSLDAKPPSASLLSAGRYDISDDDTQTRQSSIASFLPTGIISQRDSAIQISSDEEADEQGRHKSRKPKNAKTTKNPQHDAGYFDERFDMPPDFAEDFQEAIHLTHEEQEASAHKSRMLREKALERANFRQLPATISEDGLTPPRPLLVQPLSDGDPLGLQASSPGTSGDSGHMEEEEHRRNQVDRHTYESDATDHETSLKAIHTTASTKNVNAAPRPSGLELLAARRSVKDFWSTNDHRGAAPAPVSVADNRHDTIRSRQNSPFDTRLTYDLADNSTGVLPKASSARSMEGRLNHNQLLVNRHGGTRKTSPSPHKPDPPERDLTFREHDPSLKRPREVRGSSTDLARHAVDLTLPKNFDKLSEERKQTIREHEIAKESSRDLEVLLAAVEKIAQLRCFGTFKQIEKEEICGVLQYIGLVVRRKLSGKHKRAEIMRIKDNMRRRASATGRHMPDLELVQQNINLLFPKRDIEDARRQLDDLKAQIETLGGKRNRLSAQRVPRQSNHAANRDENRESEFSQNLYAPTKSSQDGPTPQIETPQSPVTSAVLPTSLPPPPSPPPPPAPARTQTLGAQAFHQDLIDRMRNKASARQPDLDEAIGDEEEDETTSSTTELDNSEDESDEGDAGGSRELFQYTVSSIYAGVEDYDSGDEYICLRTTDMERANQKVDQLATDFEKRYPPEEGLRFGRRSNRGSWENGLIERCISLGEDDVHEARFFITKQVASVDRRAYRLARTRNPTVSRIFYKVEWEKAIEHEQVNEEANTEEISWGPPTNISIPADEIFSFTTPAQANRHAANLWLSWYFRYFPGLELEVQRRRDAEEVERELERQGDFGLWAKEDSFYSGELADDDDDYEGEELQAPQRVRETFKIWVRKDHVYGPPN